MTVLVGHMPGTDPDAAVSLGARLARVVGGPLVVCTVSAPGHDEAAEATPEIEGVDVEVEHIEDRSVPGGLARAAHARQADLVVLGDGPPRPGSVGARLARVLTQVTGASWPGIVLAAGAVISIFSVTLVTMYAQSRILFSMSRDGMLPPLLSRVNPRTLTPVPTTVLVGIAVAVLAGLVPLDVLADLVSVGTLVAFSVVSIGVMVLRRTAPDLPRGFRVPGYPVTPILSIAACVYLILGLSWITHVVFVLWLAVALTFWWFYGARHSRLIGASAGSSDGEVSS